MMLVGLFREASLSLFLTAVFVFVCEETYAKQVNGGAFELTLKEGIHVLGSKYDMTVHLYGKGSALQHRVKLDFERRGVTFEKELKEIFRRGEAKNTILVIDRSNKKAYVWVLASSGYTDESLDNSKNLKVIVLSIKQFNRLDNNSEFSGAVTLTQGQFDRLDLDDEVSMPLSKRQLLSLDVEDDSNGEKTLNKNQMKLLDFDAKGQ